jgi:outer membrane protein, heavy metal efflux system
MNRAAIGVATAFVLTGCAIYRPQPLNSDPAALKAPVAAVLARDSARIERPYLQSVALDLAQPLDSNGIAVLAVIANPDLKAARLRSKVAAAQSFAARLLPDPTFSIGKDYLLSGPDQLDAIAAALGLDIHALITRSVVREKALSDERQVRLDLAWAEWQTAGQARIGAANVLGLEQIVALDQASRDATRSLLDATLSAAARGDRGADQVQAALTAAFDAAQRYRTSERDLAAARFDLTKLVGLPPGTELRLRASALPEAPLDAAQLFTIAQNQRADLLALKAGYASQEALVHKAVLDQFSKLDLTINASRDTSGNRLLGPAVAFTLPLWNRNRGGIAVERATRDALKAEYEARLFQARAEIAAAVSGIETARHQRDEILSRLPELERFVQGSAHAANRGDLPPPTALAAAQGLRDKQLQLAQNEQDIRQQWIALELLTGAPLLGLL